MTSMTRWGRPLWLLPVGGLLLGCSNGVQLGKVSGTITQGGRPVPFAYVVFQPTDPPGTYGSAYSDENGAYDIQFTAARRGAMVGRHEVTIRTAAIDEIQVEDKTTGKMVTPALPPGYLPKLEVTFDRVVEPGSNRLDFDLSNASQATSRSRDVR